MKKPIGLFRVLSFDELDLVAQLLSKYNPKDVFNILNEKLIIKAKGNEGRRKLINNLMMVWGNGQKEPLFYQKKAMNAYSTMNKEEKIIMQYLMMLIAFPFLAFEAKLAGQYLRLQDIITTKTFNDEVVNVYGSSGTIKRSISNGLGVLREFRFLTQIKPGLFTFNNDKIPIDSVVLKNYIVLAILSNTENEYLSMEQINSNSMMYGIQYNISTRDLDTEMFAVSNERMAVYIKLLNTDETTLQVLSEHARR